MQSLPINFFFDFQKSFLDALDKKCAYPVSLIENGCMHWWTQFWTDKAVHCDSVGFTINFFKLLILWPGFCKIST